VSVRRESTPSRRWLISRGSSARQEGRGDDSRSILAFWSWKAGTIQAPQSQGRPCQLKAPTREEHIGQLSLPSCAPTVLLAIHCSGSASITDLHPRPCAASTCSVLATTPLHFRHLAAMLPSVALAMRLARA